MAPSQQPHVIENHGLAKKQSIILQLLITVQNHVILLKDYFLLPKSTKVNVMMMFLVLLQLPFLKLQLS
ncbi:hypothetical protein RCL_jg28015.t1 [Rhizophagus clarus]|uniref:Uncharacterized protein n=1 Tax=Rhizophagus clarus TaxID=94130 RepID=A0A8H3M1A1_9GLOM|nr:hypothetical protein RCL_jg28015.t1 [Rhizophagus clarus]